MSRRQVHRPDTPCDQGLTSGTFPLESSLRHNHSSLEMSRYWHLAASCPVIFVINGGRYSAILTM
jgi:hypothetical protein